MRDYKEEIKFFYNKLVNRRVFLKIWMVSGSRNTPSPRYFWEYPLYEVAREHPISTLIQLILLPDTISFLPESNITYANIL